LPVVTVETCEWLLGQLVERTSIRADGGARSQMEGTARSTTAGANPKNAAVTVPAEQAPSGAAR